MLHIYNSLSGHKELFTPRIPGQVGMYVCGMTVYDYCHLGHARVMVVFDMVARWLRACGYELTYVRNITDIDDKIIQRAATHGETLDALTARFITAMHEDERALGVLPPDHEPRATQAIAPMLTLIETLIARGHAYVGPNADVYYSVESFASYGALSGKNPADLRAGARVDIDTAKRDPLDFVLWKSAKPDEPQWPSPWGPGRPGWHIECSAMAMDCLGQHIDIHGGGMDLKFPHHENEIAQSEGATGTRFVGLWMHNGFVQVNAEKMSKSLGNFFTIRDVLEHYAPEVVRYFILASHYRGPLHYSTDNLDHAKQALERFYLALRGLPPLPEAGASNDDEYGRRFTAAMDDDFNTPEALAVLFDLTRALNRARADNHLDEAVRHAATLRKWAGMLGLLQQSPEHFLQGITALTLSPEEIAELITQRNAARRARQFAEADRLRDHLKAHGITLEDHAAGTTWRPE